LNDDRRKLTGIAVVILIAMIVLLLRLGGADDSRTVGAGAPGRSARPSKSTRPADAFDASSARRANASEDRALVDAPPSKGTAPDVTADSDAEARSHDDARPRAAADRVAGEYPYPFDGSERSIANGLPRLTVQTVCESREFNPAGYRLTERERSALRDLLTEFEDQARDLRQRIHTHEREIFDAKVSEGDYDLEALDLPPGSSVSGESRSVVDGEAWFVREEGDTRTHVYVLEGEHTEYFDLYDGFPRIHEERRLAVLGFFESL